MQWCSVLLIIAQKMSEVIYILAIREILRRHFVQSLSLLCSNVIVSICHISLQNCVLSLQLMLVIHRKRFVCLCIDSKEWILSQLRFTLLKSQGQVSYVRGFYGIASCRISGIFLFSAYIQFIVYLSDDAMWQIFSKNVCFSGKIIPHQATLVGHV